MSAVYAVFAYLDKDVDEIYEHLFDASRGSSELIETVNERRIALADNEDISVRVDAPELDDNVSVTPSDIPCLVLRRGKGGVLMDEGEESYRDLYVGLFITIYQHLLELPVAGYATGIDQSGGIKDNNNYYYHPVTSETLRENRFYDGAWVLFFTPEMVDTYGKETLFELPARRIEELNNETIVVVAPGDPTVYTEFRQIATALNLPATKERSFN